jgi:hypothetical protein
MNWHNQIARKPRHLTQASVSQEQLEVSRVESFAKVLPSPQIVLEESHAEGNRKDYG